MLKKVNHSAWTLGSKLSAATFLAVSAIMVIFVVAFAMSVTTVIVDRTEANMRQSLAMIKGF